MKKYKLLICDDEVFVTKGLRETIDWDELGVEIVGDCKNGKQGLAAAHALQPDLVITDVRMPVMDGLQLAEALARENFNGAVLIYSGYGDFEYARKALDCGVTSYLLKPVDNETLKAKVREAIAALEKERSKRRALQNYEISLPILRRDLTDRLLAGDTGAADELRALGVAVPPCGLVVYAKRLGEAKPDGALTIRTLLAGLTEALAAFAVLDCLRESDFAVVTDLDDVSVLRDCLRGLLSEESGGEKFAVAISKPYAGEAAVPAAYRQAAELCADAFFPLVHHLRTAGDDEGVRRRSRLVEDALAYIAENYGRKVSVRSAAEKLFVSESHLMHEMKEVLGKTFNECLTAYRMLKAREMLAERRLRINEVASKVGYSDVRYFGRVFGEATGMSPKEYAESVLRKKC